MLFVVGMLFLCYFLGVIEVVLGGVLGVLVLVDSVLFVVWGGIFNGLSYLIMIGWNLVEW